MTASTSAARAIGIRDSQPSDNISRTTNLFLAHHLCLQRISSSPVCLSTRSNSSRLGVIPQEVVDMASAVSRMVDDARLGGLPAGL